MLKFTPLEFETGYEQRWRAYDALKFTPLEFETATVNGWGSKVPQLKFTPLEFETINRLRNIKLSIER